MTMRHHSKPSFPSLRTTCATLATVVTFAFASSPVSAQLFEYRFNDQGTESASRGNDRTPVTFFDENNQAVDLHSADSMGVSGQPGDRAFDNTSATGMGGEHSMGSRAQQSPTGALDSLTSFTLQGWFAFPGDGSFPGARLVEKRGSATSQLSLFLGAGSRQGALTLALGTPSSDAVISTVSEMSPLLGTRNTWTFFAVTYDGTLARDNVRFYAGSITAKVEQVGPARTLSAGALGSIPGPLVFGNNQRGNRPWQGLLDNFRVFGTTAGQEAALPLEELERLRLVDVSEAQPQ